MEDQRDVVGLLTDEDRSEWDCGVRRGVGCVLEVDGNCERGLRDIGVVEECICAG